MPPGELEIRLLGMPTVRLGGRDITPSVRKGMALIAYLALEGSTNRHQLADLLWSDLGERDARRNLRQELWRLQRSALAPWIDAQPHSVALNLAFQTDVARFQQHLAHTDLPEALALYGGPLMTQFELGGAGGFEDWLTRRREDLRTMWKDALQRHGAQLERQGDARGALKVQLQLLEDDEFQEVHQREAIRLHLLLGERAEGLRRYEAYAQLLNNELGLQPLPETQALTRTLREPMAASPDTAAPTRHLPRVPGLPLIGRRAEWTALQRATAALTLVTGEPGIGKSRLAEAFATTFGTSLHLRAFEISLGTPLYPVAEALRTALANPKTAERMATLNPPWRAEVARLVPELAPSPPDMLPADGRARFLSGVAQALMWVVGPQGVLVFDDLHWADPMTVELLMHLVRQSLAQRPRLIATARPQELAGQATLSAALATLDRAGALHRMPLEGLRAPDVLTLIQMLSGSDAGHHFATRLLTATSGNPLYLLESLRHLFELQVLHQGADGRWSTPFDASTTDHSELPLPDSVRDAIVQRVSHHGPSARRLLEAASLSDEGFSLDDLMPALSLSEWEAVEALERLLEAGLLTRRSAQGYGFSHDLVRRVMLQGLGPERSRLIHRRLAERLERAGATASRIARHLEAAGQRTQAAPWRVRAAQDAAQVYAHAEALAQYESALADGVSGQDAFAIHLERETVFRLLGDAGQRGETLETLTSLATSLNQPALILEAGLRRLAWLNDLFQFAEAARLSRELLDHPALSPITRARALSSGAEALLRLDEIGPAEAWFGQVTALDAAPPSLKADAHAGGRICAMIRGDFLLAQAHNRASLEGYRVAGDRGGEASALTGIGRVGIALGEYATAHDALQQALSTAEEIGDRSRALLAVYSMMWLDSQRGLFRRSLERYRAAVELNAGIRNRGCAVGLEMYRARALQQGGALGESLKVARAATTAAERHGSQEMLLVARRYEALTQLALGDAEGAAAHFQRALVSMPHDALRSQIPVLETGLARCALQRGDLEVAMEHLKRAQALGHLMYFAEQRDLTLTLADVQLRLGQPGPALDATARPDEVLHLRARSLTLRLEALHTAGLLSVEAIRDAQTWLEGTDVPALEGLELRWALVHAFEEHGRPQEAAQARRKAEAQLRALAATLEPDPEWKRRFLQGHARRRASGPRVSTNPAP